MNFRRRLDQYLLIRIEYLTVESGFAIGIGKYPSGRMQGILSDDRLWVIRPDKSGRTLEFSAKNLDNRRGLTVNDPFTND